MNKEIVSSTGNLGVSRRSYDRLYVNGTTFSADPITVENNVRRLLAIGDRRPEKFSRTVFRGLVSPMVIDHIVGNGLDDHLEVALPMRDFTHDDSTLIYIAKNHPRRTVITPIEQMIRETTYHKPETKSPVERVKDVIAKHYSFTNQIEGNRDIDQILKLWGDTFGWTRDEVINFKMRLEEQQYLDPALRSVWFVATKDAKGDITSLAMAEKLSIPGKDGKVIDLVESTEWRVRDNQQGNGLMPATLSMLHAQVLNDLEKSENGIPLLFAECNYQKRADLSGYAVGLRIPDRVHATQIIKQNVFVGDGTDVPEGILRDFTFMFLPLSAIQEKYGRSQREEMLQYIR